MTRIKVYKDIVDVPDLITEIIKLMDLPKPEPNNYPYCCFKLTDVEYEDEFHIFHYAQDTCTKALKILNFELIDGLKPYLFRKKDIVIAFQINYTANELLIQRQDYKEELPQLTN